MNGWKIYAYDGCDTCRKALKFLNGKGVTYQKIDIMREPPTVGELEKMLAFVGDDIRKLFNTSGQAYRQLKLSEKLPKMSTKEAIALLAGNGRLVKRPFVLHPKGGFVGFRQPEWEKVI